MAGNPSKRQEIAFSLAKTTKTPKKKRPKEKKKKSTQKKIHHTQVGALFPIKKSTHFQLCHIPKRPMVAALLGPRIARSPTNQISLAFSL